MGSSATNPLCPYTVIWHRCQWKGLYSCMLCEDLWNSPYHQSQHSRNPMTSKRSEENTYGQGRKLVPAVSMRRSPPWQKNILGKLSLCWLYVLPIDLSLARICFWHGNSDVWLLMHSLANEVSVQISQNRKGHAPKRISIQLMGTEWHESWHCLSVHKLAPISQHPQYSSSPLAA